MDEQPAFQHSIDSPQRHAKVPANFHAYAYIKLVFQVKQKQAQSRTSELVHMHECDACCWDRPVQNL